MALKPKKRSHHKQPGQSIKAAGANPLAGFVPHTVEYEEATVAVADQPEAEAEAPVETEAPVEAPNIVPPRQSADGKTAPPISFGHYLVNLVPLHDKLPLINRLGGKKPEVQMRRALYFSLAPYGFQEKMMDKVVLLKYGIIPVQDERGYVYVVREAVGEDGKPVLEPDGSPVLKNWPSAVTFPKTSARRLGRARSWPSVAKIRQGERSFWQKAFGWGVLVIGGMLIVVTFFLLYFMFMA